MPVTEVLRIVAAVSAEAGEVWIGGGWGVDALLGFQSRPHWDLDLVLDSFEASLADVTAGLATVGYHCVSRDRAGVWLPHRATFEDGHGRSVEVLGIDWSVLDAAWSLVVPSSVRASREASERKTRCFARGELAGHEVPCLSRAAQLLFHSGYAPREQDLRDVRHLEALAAQRAADRDRPLFVGETGLIVPLVGLDPHVLRVWSELNGSTTNVPPHVTIMFPFLPGDQITGHVLDRVAAVFAASGPFDVTFDETGWFDRRVMYLRPNQAQPFIDLVNALMAEFPECQPYGGAFTDIKPHFTIAEDRSYRILREAEVRVRRHLPITCAASQVWLLTSEGPGGAWSAAHAITLGAGHAADLLSAPATRAAR